MITVSWNMMLIGLAATHQHFERTICLHLYQDMQ